MSKKSENAAFICANCGENVPPATNGSYRNHCPFCLYSLHADIEPGDRASKCNGLMKPVDVEYNTRKGWQIKHECVKCGFERRNLLCNDGICRDNMEIVYKIMKEKC